MDFASLIAKGKTLFGRLGTGAQSVAAIDIGSSSVKVIQLRQDKGRVVLETYGELATGPYVEQAIGQAVVLDNIKLITVLRDLFREANVTAKVGAMSIPLRSSLLVAIDIPRLAKSDLATAVPTEARKYVPVPIQEVMLDWWVIPETNNNEVMGDQPANDLPPQVEVLVAAIHKDTVRNDQELSQNISLENRFFEIETFSAIRAAVSNDLSATAIVDFGAGTTKVAIIDYGVIRFSHTINKGGQDLSVALSRSLNVSFAKAEEIKRQVGLVEKINLAGEVSTVISPIMEYIFNEISRTIVNYQKKRNRAIEKIIFIGGGTQLPGLLEAAQKNLEPTVVFGTPFDKMETPAFLEPVLKEAGPSFAVAIGLALRLLEG